MKTKTTYADTADLTCTENGKIMTAEILDFRQAYMLTCSIDRSVRVTLRYNTGKKLYIGNVGSLEFTSTGPKGTVTIQGRRG